MVDINKIEVITNFIIIIMKGTSTISLFILGYIDLIIFS